MFELMVLAKLMCRPCHGYELKTYLANLNPNNNKIYPTLRQLHDQGYVEAQTQIQQGRPNRKTYSITPEGQAYFLRLLKDFDFAKAQNADEFNIRISFSYLLDREIMSNILQLRRQALQHLSTVPDLTPEAENHADITRLRALHAQLRSLELDYLDEMRAKYTDQ